MKICIIGAGAIGGLLGVHLSRADEKVTLIESPGPHLDAIKKNGLKLRMDGKEELIARDFEITDDMSQPGVQDIVVIGVKAYQIRAIASGMRALFGPQTAVITIQNGIPWWYFQKHGGRYQGRRLESADPSGEIHANIEPERIIGCVVYPAAEVIAPGIIKHVEGNRFPVGEIDGSMSERVENIAQALNNAGFKSFVLDDVRAEIWLKAWGNLTFNPISALTRATLAGICRFPPTRELAAIMMEEAQTIAGKLGISFRHTIEKRIAGAESVGDHKTSMLQDVEAGRQLEVEALLGTVIELGRLTDTPTPHIDAVYAMVKLLDKTISGQQGM